MESPDLHLLTMACCLAPSVLMAAAWLAGLLHVGSPIPRRAWRWPAALLLFWPSMAALLMFAPVLVTIPGDHETRACGNSFGVTRTRTSLTDPANDSSAYTDCVETVRVRRTAAAVMLGGTVLAVTALALRHRRRVAAVRPVAGG